MSEDTSLKLYLRQIDSVPLLSEAREKELARRIIRSNDPAARDELVRANLRLVAHVAKHYARRGLPMQDLIEEGNIGLLKAVDGFNPDMNIRFSTYASWWIQQSLRRALHNKVPLIHIPGYMLELIAKWKRTVCELESKLGHEPDLEEFAAHLQVSVRKARILRRTVRTFSADAPQDEAEGRGSGKGWTSKVGDARERQPDQIALDEDALQAIRTLLEHMDRREAQILRLRFGLEGEQVLTLKEIGGMIGLTRERVRQIENEALDKLKAYLS